MKTYIFKSGSDYAITTDREGSRLPLSTLTPGEDLFAGRSDDIIAAIEADGYYLGTVTVTEVKR